MTYSNESVYGAWGRTKDWRKRREETTWDCQRNKELRLFVMFHTTIILYDISSDKYLQYIHVGRKASHNVEGFLVGFYLCQYFGCWALLSWYYTSSYVDSFHGERRRRKVEKREWTHISGCYWNCVERALRVFLHHLYLMQIVFFFCKLITTFVENKYKNAILPFYCACMCRSANPVAFVSQ